MASLSRIQCIAGKLVALQKRQMPLVVVVSAMGKTTTQLFALAQQLAVQPQRRELDMLVTAGERVSMALLSMAIVEAGGKAISLTGSQSGIITTTVHGQAQIIDVRPERILQALAQGLVVVVAGYQGMSLEREVTTLGRGGSDTTAVALAHALQAKQVIIYSDVAGLYSADPYLVSTARHFSCLPYHQALQMAQAGARVLNDEAVALAQGYGLKIVARKTLGKSKLQTVVGAAVCRRRPAVIGLTTALLVPLQLTKVAEAVLVDHGAYWWQLWGSRQQLFDCRGCLPRALQNCRQQLRKLRISTRIVSLVTCIASSWAQRQQFPEGWRRTTFGATFVVAPLQMEAMVRQLHRLLYD